MKKIIILAIIALIVTIIPILSYAQTFTSSTTHSFTSSFTYNVWPVSNVPNGYRSNKLTAKYSDGWLFVDADATTFFQVYPYGSGFASVRLRGTDGVDFLSTSTTVVRPEEISANTKCNTKHATYALFYGRAGEYTGEVMMKLIGFSLRKLINNIRNNIILFLILFIGMFLSAIALIYFYGNMTYYMKNKDSAELQYRTYSVLRTSDYGWVKENNGTLNSSFGLPNNMVSLERVQSVFREDSRVENIFLYSILCESETNEIFITNSNTQFISSLVIEDNYKVYIKERKGRIEFTESEKLGDYVVIVPATCYLNIGEYIELYGKEYKIIGQHTLDDVFYIPFNTMIKEQLPTLKLQLIVNKRIIDAKEDTEFCEYLYDKFLTEPVFDKNGEVLNVGIGSPYFYLETDFEESFSEVLFLCVLYIFSSIIFMILFKFFWDMQRYDNMVLMLIGATKGDISFVCLIQMITLSLIPSLLAVLVHACLQTSFFAKVNWQDNIWYQRKDYLFLLAIMILLTLIISIPLVIRYNKKRLGEILSDEKNIGFL